MQVVSPSSEATDSLEKVRTLYLNLLKRSLTGDVTEDNDSVWGGVYADRSPEWSARVVHRIGSLLDRRGIEVATKAPYNLGFRTNGLDMPERSMSMIGLKRMDNIRSCVESVLADDVPGDLIETGVWRGGACIFMRGVLKAHGCTNRKVWVADSFQGLPAPNPSEFPSDNDFPLSRWRGFSVGIDEVRRNFDRYGLLDENVIFLPGWFKDTLPTAPISEISVMRLDGDMYESTIQSLDALYPKLSPGGYCIIDDFGAFVEAQKAVHDYRAAHGLTETIIDIDGLGAFWRKS